jgi:hypothetical protein
MHARFNMIDCTLFSISLGYLLLVAFPRRDHPGSHNQPIATVPERLHAGVRIIMAVHVQMRPDYCVKAVMLSLLASLNPYAYSELLARSTIEDRQNECAA